MRTILLFFKKYWLPSLVIILLAIAFVYLYVLPALQNHRAKNDILTGDLQYFPTIGWVDMGHANPTGPIKIVETIDKHRKGTLTYSQDMKKHLFGITLVVRMTNQYSIPENLGKKRNGILRYVFEDVSKDFENLQASHPFRALCGKAVGDINGDRLALLRSLNLEEPDCLSKPVDKTIALKKFEEGENLTATSPYLSNILPKPIKVFKYRSERSYFIQ